MRLVATKLSDSEYKMFHSKAEELNMSEYELAKTAIKVFIREPNASEKTMVQKLIDFWNTLP
jgi:hypothetical protein